MNKSPSKGIVLIHGTRKRFIRLEEGKAVIVGRSPEADFFLNATSISRRHCAIMLVKGEVVAEDLKSRNYCFIDNEKITRGVLQHGCAFQLGKIPFRVEFIVDDLIRCQNCGFEFAKTEEEGAIVCPQCWSIVAIEDSGTIWDGLEKEGFRVVSMLTKDPPVFKAERVELGRTYRVKVLPLRHDQNPGVVEGFLQDARLAASLVHEKIVQVFDFRRCPTFIYVVMEYDDGKSLADTVAESGPLALEQGLKMALDLCDAVEHAQERKVVHGNISPQVVFLVNTGLTKLADYSLARQMVKLTGTFALGNKGLGETLMAPEVVLNPHPEAIDVRADFFGIGVVLCFALTGRSAFPNLTALEYARALAQAEKPEPNLEGVPAELIDLVSRLLKIDPQDRPSKVSELREELRWVLRSNSSEDDFLDTVGSDSAMFSGAISANELVEFVQMVELHGKTGVLSVKGEIASGKIRGTMSFRDGRIVEAKEGNQEPAKAARRLIGTRSGRFSFTPQDPNDVKQGAVNLHVSALLLDLAREQDESGMF